MQSVVFQGGEGAAVTAAQAVYEALRREILNLDLPPGTPLHRTALATKYGVSLTPLREAMAMLEQDGLVRIVPQSGTVVKRIDVPQLFETHFLRVAVETEVVRRLARQGGGEALRKARAILKMQEALAGDTEQVAMFNDLDRSFHLALFAGLGMEGLHLMLHRRLGHLARCQRLDLPSEGKMASILAHHGAILDAIEAGDSEAATRAMREHLSGTIRRLDALRAQVPEYFSG